MRNWNISDSKGKQATVRAWSARHAKFLGLALGITATKIVLIGRPNPDNPDGWKAR